jgi:hypothetical protein
MPVSIHSVQSNCIGTFFRLLPEIQIRMARRRNRERIAAGTAEIVQGDAAALPWENGRFSAVACDSLPTRWSGRAVEARRTGLPARRSMDLLPTQGAAGRTA